MKPKKEPVKNLKKPEKNKTLNLETTTTPVTVVKIGNNPLDLKAECKTLKNGMTHSEGFYVEGIEHIDLPFIPPYSFRELINTDLCDPNGPTSQTTGKTRPNALKSLLKLQS